uniref:Phospholipid scramblase n=1 Tax=Terrapene triunguis TaxID=2587831 RepID=A0A674J5U6_9SAUR
MHNTHTVPAVHNTPTTHTVLSAIHNTPSSQLYATCQLHTRHSLSHTQHTWSGIGFETANKYELRDGLGRRLFEAKEQSDCCTRNCCGSLRRLRLSVAEPGGRPVLRLLRPLKCATCWCPCCLQELEVQCPPGTTIRHVVQKWHLFTPKFSVQNAEKWTVLRVLGPCCVFRCWGDVNFEVAGGLGRVGIGVSLEGGTWGGHVGSRMGGGVWASVTKWGVFLFSVEFQWFACGGGGTQFPWVLLV